MTAGLRALFLTLILAAVAWTTREIPTFGYLPLVDDDVNIFFNEHLGAPGASTLHWMATDFGYVHRYMPLGWLGFSLVYTFSGLDPMGYHAAGIALHAANALLVYVILGQLLGRFAGSTPERQRVLCAGFAALLWAVHPLRVETTAWCSGLLYSQSGFFALAYAGAHLAELRALASGRLRRSAGFFILGWASFAASVLTYPVALFLPFAMGVVDWAWFASHRGEAGRPWRRTLAREGAVWATALAGLALTVHARATVVSSWGRTPTLAEFGFVDRGLQAAYVAAVYLFRTFWHADLSWLPLTLFDQGACNVLGWAAAAILAGISAAVWLLRGRAPFLGICWVVYLVLLVPNLGLNEHPHTIADRYLYVTGVVLCAALALALARIRSGRVLAAALSACALGAAACAALSLEQARVWRDTESFQAHILDNPDSDLDHITAARIGKLRFLEGDVRGGREAVHAELSKAPGVGGVILTWHEVAPDRELAPAVAASRLQEWPAAPFSCAAVQIARAQVSEGRVADALLHLDEALRRSPDFAEARVRRGLLLAALGRPREALHDWLFLEVPRGGADSVPAGELALLANTLERGFEANGEPGDARAVAAGLGRAERAR